MPQLDKKSLSERDICTKFITPALVAAGWNIDTQIREEVGFTDGRIYVRGKIHKRGKQKRADHSRLLALELAHPRAHAALLLQAVLKEAFTPEE